ncbi:MAG: hypothetical protein WD403_01065 [Pirellulales bacterium]
MPGAADEESVWAAEPFEVSREQAIGGGGVRVVFDKAADRYAHRIELTDEAGLVVLESIEGTPGDAWPPSPPLKEIQIEREAQGGWLALLVGMAGRSHWSLSIALDPLASRLTFDAACRLGQEPAWLGSRYRLLAQPESSQWHRAWRFEPCETLGELSEVTLHEPGPLPSSGVLLEVRPSSASGAGPRTVRWKYSVARLAVS